ncbi:CpsB/CapC family capsule biosynthesis tyrosine phosphatase [Eubacterium xylanophilum]|uniref:CpsB/CapC family capsule biosynthesis tyrosine phosphatase n=1 Tax=Eubacterium xylanophilum TaxID=39497 RepID=UPI0004BC7C69|nr:CpsB/CapC family capsule biosynthesis tyrosine phosphatase [Eubacterium xylanophilum]
MKKGYRIIVIIIFAFVSLFIPSDISIFAAGNINSEEERVISAASGSFEYEGVTYKAKAEYLSKLRAKLSEDKVDLDASQASEAIDNIYSNVKTGVDEGYLEPVDGEGASVKPKKKKSGISLDDILNEDSEDNKDSENQKAQQSDNNKGSGGLGDEDSSTASNTSEPEKQDLSTEKPKSEVSIVTDSPGKEDSEKPYVNPEPTDSPVMDPVGPAVDPVIIGIVILILLIIAIIVIWRYFSRTKRDKTVNSEQIIQDICSAIGGFSDVHSHMLPGVDDGAQSMGEAISLITMAYEKGFRKIFLTPHYIPGRNKCNAEELQTIFKDLKKKVMDKFGDDITLYLGNEILYREGVVREVNEGKALTMGDSRYVLVEFNINVSYNELYNALKQFVQNSYIPILAHYERYECLLFKEERVREIHGLGVGMQINYSSFIGADKRARFCRKMVRLHLVHFLGTDAHDTKRRVPNIHHALSEMLEDGVTEHRVRMITHRNFDKIINDKVL